MTDFKLKINLNGASVELEGEGTLVKEIFSDIKETGLGVLTKLNFEKMPASANTENANLKAIPVSGGIIPVLDNGKEYPALDDFMLTDKVKDEQERILVYVLYISDFGKTAVSDDDIREKYKETNCWNRSVSNNFKANIKKLIGKKKYLRSCDNGYILTKEGKEEAEKVIFDESDTGKTNKKGKTNNGVLQRYEMLTDLGLTDEDKKSLMNLFLNKGNLSAIDKILLVSNWYKSNKNIGSIDINTAYTLLKYANISANFSIRDALGNAKKKNYFYPGSNKGEFDISHIGEAAAEKLIQE